MKLEWMKHPTILPSGNRRWKSKDGRYMIHLSDRYEDIPMPAVYIAWFWYYPSGAWRRLHECSTRSKAEKACEQHAKLSGYNPNDFQPEQLPVVTSNAQTDRSETVMATTNAAVVEDQAATTTGARKKRATKRKTADRTNTKATKRGGKKTTKGTKPSKKAKGAKGSGKKANTAPKRAPMPDGKSVHANEPTREPVWNARRIAVVKAMRKLRANDPKSARTAGEIGSKAGTVDGVDLGSDGGVKKVKIHLDVYRTAELVHNGFVKTFRPEGSRELNYFLTAKGMKTDFPQKEKKSK